MIGRRIGPQSGQIFPLDLLLDTVIPRLFTLNNKLSYVFVLCGFL